MAQVILVFEPQSVLYMFVFYYRKLLHLIGYRCLNNGKSVRCHPSPKPRKIHVGYFWNLCCELHIMALVYS